MAGRKEQAEDTKEWSDSYLKELDPEYHYQLATDEIEKVLLGITNETKAIWEMERAIELDPTNSYYYMELGSFLVENNRKEEGIQKIKEGVDLNPTLENKLRYIDVLGKMNGRGEEAEECVNELIEEYEDNYDLKFLKASIFCNQKKYKKMEKYCDKMIKNENYDRFCEILEEERKKSAEEWIGVDDIEFSNWGQFHELKAEALKYQFKYEEALKACEISIVVEIDAPHKYILKSQILYGLNRYEEALEAAEKAIELGDNDENDLKYLILVRLKRFEEAIAIIDDHLSIWEDVKDPRSIKHLIDKVMCIYRSSESKEEIFKIITKIYENDPSLKENNLLNLFCEKSEYFLNQLNDFETSICYSQLAIEINSLHAPSNFIHAENLRHLQQFNHSITYYNRAIDIDPTNKSYIRSKSIAYSKLGDYSAALSQIDQIDDWKNDHECNFLRSLYLRQLGRYDDALSHLDVAISILPDEKYVEEMSSLTRFLQLARKRADNYNDNNDNDDPDKKKRKMEE